MKTVILLLLLFAIGFVAAQTLTQSSSNYLNPARGDIAGAYTSGRFYFGGGESGGPSANVDIFDTTTNTWSTSLLSSPRDNLAAASLTDRVVFAGGSNGGANGDAVDFFFANGSRGNGKPLSEDRHYLLSI